MLLAFDGKSKIFKHPVSTLLEDVSPTDINWVIFEKRLYRFDNLPDSGKRDYDKVYPIWNFQIRDALLQKAEAPDKTNKYKKFRHGIDKFYAKYLNTEEFKTIIPITSNGFIPVNKINIGSVDNSSNRLLFGKESSGIAPMDGMKEHGPFGLSPTTKIHYFFIFHKNDQPIAQKMDSYFKGTETGFKGLVKFIHTLTIMKKGSALDLKTETIHGQKSMKPLPTNTLNQIFSTSPFISVHSTRTHQTNQDERYTTS